jgi:hypothetical protein
MECMFVLEDMRAPGPREFPLSKEFVSAGETCAHACGHEGSYTLGEDHSSDDAEVSLSPPASAGPRKGLKKGLPNGPADLDVSPGSSPATSSPKPSMLSSHCILSDHGKEMGMYSLSQSSACTTVSSSSVGPTMLMWPSPDANERNATDPAIHAQSSCSSMRRPQSVLDDSRCVKHFFCSVCHVILCSAVSRFPNSHHLVQTKDFCHGTPSGIQKVSCRISSACLIHACIRHEGSFPMLNKLTRSCKIQKIDNSNFFLSQVWPALQSALPDDCSCEARSRCHHPTWRT